MAKKLKADEGKKQFGVSADDLKRVVADITKHKERASENNGLAGQSTKNAIDRYGLDRAALGVIMKLGRSEISKQQCTLRAIIDYADKMGMFDQIDAFDDMIPTLRQIVERADKAATEVAKKSVRKGVGASGDVIAQLVN